MTRSSRRDDVPAGSSRSATGPWLVRGALAGLLAGVAFIALNSWFATSMGNPWPAPFRVIATLVQGPPPAQATVWVGVLVHAVLSVAFGLVFAAAVAAVRGWSATAALLWAGLLYGALVYLVDFQALARLVPQFAAFRATNQPFELAAHLVFGAVLAALLLTGSRPGSRPADDSQAGPG